MIELDINSLVQNLELTKNELDEVRELVVKAYVDEAYLNTTSLAREKLGSSRGAYLDALNIRQIDRFTWELVLDSTNNPLAGMIENGASSFDMKVNFARSGKKKMTKSGGWYLTIPLLFRTTNAKEKSGAPGQILPCSIYDLIRNSPSTTKEVDDKTVSTLSGDDIPKRYQPGQLMMKQLNRTADQYMPKNSIYAGLIRNKDNASGKSTYNTFRKVSSNSDPKSWIHPGIPAYNLMDQAANSVDQLDIAETALQKYFPSETINVRIYGKLALDMNMSYNKMLGEMNTAIADEIKGIINYDKGNKIY